MRVTWLLWTCEDLHTDGETLQKSKLTIALFMFSKILDPIALINLYKADFFCIHRANGRT